MFSIILFSICFCLASIAMYEPESESSTTVDNFEQFYSAVKEVFAIEPEVITESTEPLSSAQTNINSAWVTPEEQELMNPTTQFTIRQLRDHVRQQNLQAMIKEQLGKSVNHCRKEELLSVLFA